jgi:lipopolysaccharide transport system ATP-binding protein
VGRFIITVEKLSKRYRIGHQRAKGDGLRHSIELAVRNPFRWFGVRRKAAAEQNTDFWALRDVSFEVKKGEVVGIIGRNGAGKSTLLKILSRITEPSAGRIHINGRVASLLEVGTGFHPELTGRENIFLNGAILGMTKVEIKAKFDEIVAFSEIEKFLDTPVKRYSSGMYVRLAFAVAAHLEPEILIVDEVLAVGDAEFQNKCLGKMESVSRKQGRTVLFVSHNMAAVQQLCSRGILLRQGSVAMDGRCSEVTDNYLADASSGQNGCVDLRTHPARSKGGSALITQVVIRNSLEEPSSCVRPQENLIVDIVTESVGQIKEPRVAIAVEDSHGRRLMTMASYFAQADFPSVQDRATFRCECGPLFLAPGRYLLSVSIGSRNIGMLDSIDGAIWFEVIWDNNFKSGEPYHSVYGPLLKDSKWRLLK